VSTEIQESPAEVVEFKKTPEWKRKNEEKKAAKAKEREEKLQKRMQEQQALMAKRYAERREKLLANGVKPEAVDGVIAQMDFEALSVENQVKVMSRNLNNILGQLMTDVASLKHNDEVLADSMDLNFRAMARCLEKAGVKPEEQQAIIGEVQKEMETEIKARMEAEAEAIKKQAAEQHAAMQEAEKGRIEAELSQIKDTPFEAAPEQGPAEFPEAAQVFGGTRDN
jgi:hypothetical protein